jgi:predicted nucleic acid-binding protein
VSLVVDASAVLHLVASEKGMQPLDGHDLVAPALLWSEATSVLNETRWRGEISEELAKLAFDRLLDAPITRRSGVRLYREAEQVARDLGWAKTYDAEYVALARIEGIRLVTQDARLQRGAGRLIEIVGIDDVDG